MAVYSRITDSPTPVDHGTKYGTGNELPPNFKRITEADFAKSLFFVYTPIATEYRQCQIADYNENRYCGVKFFFFHDGTGIAMTNDYWGGKIAYFSFAACVHKFSELSYAECQKRGIYHGGRCYHVSLCDKCGYVSAVDSSD